MPHERPTQGELPLPHRQGGCDCRGPGQDRPARGDRCSGVHHGGGARTRHVLSPRLAAHRHDEPVLRASRRRGGSGRQARRWHASDQDRSRRGRALSTHRTRCCQGVCCGYSLAAADDVGARRAASFVAAGCHRKRGRTRLGRARDVLRYDDGRFAHDRAMEFAFIVDPVHLLKAYKDTSVAMMRALQARGETLFVIEQADIFWSGRRTLARVRSITVSDDHHDWHHLGDSVVRPLASFAAVVMRKDPPFDMEYVYSTYLLELAEREGARVVNRPRAIRDHNEKMAIARFAEFTVPTLVTRDAGLLDGFIDEHADVILKPLDGMGGISIFRVR